MLLSLGDYAWDVLVRPQAPFRTGEDLPGEVRLAPGGGAANVAVWASRMGAKSAFLGKVGEDFFGRLAEEELRVEGVRPFLVKDPGHATAAVAVWVDAAGERTQIYSYGADYFLTPEELPEAAFREAALVPAEGCFVHIPAPPVPVVDATGAGDAFAGVFLAAILAGRPPLEAARAAVLVASWVVASFGARPKGAWPRPQA